MKLTKRCLLNGNIYTMEIPSLTPEKLLHIEQRRANGALIQDAAWFLDSDEREFLLTGTPPEVWDNIFGDGSR